MESLRSMLKEIVGLFVDDGYLVFAVVAWIALTWLFAPQLHAVRGNGWILFLGLAALLLESARRRARQ